MPSSTSRPNLPRQEFRLGCHSNVRENHGFLEGDSLLLVGENDWLRVTDLGDGVTLIEEPFADDLVSANIWHVRGSWSGT